MAAYSTGKWDGIGYAFSESDPYMGLDLDDCRDPETGEFRDWAKRYLEQLASYAEISPSGLGAKVWIKAKTEQGRHDDSLGVFTKARYFCVTGQAVNDHDKIEARQDVIDQILKERWRDDLKLKPTPQKPPPASFIMDDTLLLEKIGASKMAKKMRRLWGGDYSDYRGKDGMPDHSAGDQALVSCLSFWTQDTAQIDRLFRQSKLYRDKWDKKHHSDGRTYGELTIEKALTGLNETYSPGGGKKNQKPAVIGTNSEKAEEPPQETGGDDGE